MILEIVKYADPILRAKGKYVERVTDEVRELAANMLETMRAANGVGLAAQQVGMPLQLAIIDVSNVEDRPSTLEIGGRLQELEEWMPMVLLNPQLELAPETEIGVEGCLSFPELTADIERASAVTARARMLDGGDIEFSATGLLARALQHEVDHLNGILFIDRMSSAVRASLAGRLKRMQKENVVSR
jgi:peptide deformylase